MLFGVALSLELHHMSFFFWTSQNKKLSKCCDSWCVPFVLRSWKLQGERTRNSDFQLGKSLISPPRLRNPRWLLRASTVVKATVFVCAKCHVILCYPLVLLTMANLVRANPSTTKVFLEASLLVFRLVVTGTRSTRA